MIAWLKANQIYGHTLIVALSDHGESLGDHGEQEHGFFVYNSTIRIPLIVKPPAGSGFEPGRVDVPVETTAVAPTLLELAGLKDEIVKQFTSPSLLGEKRDADRPAYSETFYTFDSFGWSPLHSLETQRFHYIDAPRPELYDLSVDPDEKNNLAMQQKGTVAVLKGKLQALLQHNPYKAATDTVAGMSPDAQEKLRALGYVAYHSPVSAEAIAKGLPDPKDKLDEFNAILKAEDAIHSSNFSQGESELKKIEQQDPDLYIVPFLLGETAARRQDWDSSAAEFKRSLQLNPNFDQAMTGLARALYFSRNAEEAMQWARSALKQNPLNYKALYELGSIEAHGDKAAAISDYKKAIAIQDNFAPLHRDLGMLYFEQKDYAAAATQLDRAAALGINDAHLFNFLGICYDRTNRLQHAIETYHRALKLDPALAEGHLNLGFTYHRVGRDALAQSEYRRACDLNRQFCNFVAPSERPN